MSHTPILPPELKPFYLAFLDLLERWNRRHKLTALPPGIREEELLQDSSVLLPWIHRLESGSKVVDFGTGMGVPAMLLAAARKDIRVIAMDKTTRKLAFVRQAILELGLENLQVLSGRIEEQPPLGAGLGTAKAVGPLVLLLNWWERHGSPHSPFLALKGPAWQEELPVSGWSFRAHPYHLPTRGERVLVEAWKDF
jgi:16S rRNA (guanine527-N7)-methyltransferase